MRGTLDPNQGSDSVTTLPCKVGCLESKKKIDSETPKLDSEKKRSVIPKTDLLNNQSTLMTSTKKYSP